MLELIAEMMGVVLMAVAVCYACLSTVRCACFVWRRTLTWLAKRDRSKYLDSKKKCVIPSASAARSAFRALDSVSVKPSSTHSHAVLAAARAKAVAMMQEYALVLGRRLFMLQKSRRDVEHGIAGSRTYYWIKDTDVEACDETPGPNDLVGIVDTDYYMDMNDFLLDLDCPVVIYTMTPTLAGETLHDGLSFCFNVDNELVASVSGGATYRHRLWDYGVDVFAVRGSGVLTSYDVDRRSITRHSSLIALTPRHRWTGFAASLAATLEAAELRRLTICEDGWNVMYVQTATEHLVSIAEAGCHVAVSIPMEVYQGLRSTVLVSKNPLTIGMVESSTAGCGVSHAQAAILCRYFRESMPVPNLRVYPVEYAVKRFQWGRYDPDAKASLVAFMSPIVNDALTPDPTEGNEKRSLDKRVTELAQEELPITPDLVQYATEFVALLVPEPHRCVPVDEEVVFEKQSRPTQRRLIADAANFCWEMIKRTVKAFMKKEAYPKITDPRNISTIHCKDKLEYSRMVYSVTELLKNSKWYAFGKTPKSIAQRVADICQSAQFVIPSDYSRLDGTITNLCRLVERAFFMRAMHPRYHAQLEMLMKTQYKQQGIGAFGTRYKTGWSRLSGSPETSTCNTLITGFVPYMAFRRMGYSPAEAYEKLGIYGGDDGLTPDIDQEEFRCSAESLGLKLTVERIHRGQPGVHFLARLYTPDVWFGTVDSMCDLKRQLSKFHTCVAGGTESEVTKLREKSYSFYLTDKNTPIIGSFVSSVVRMMQRDGIVLVNPECQNTANCSYSSLAPLDEQYPNDHHEWFDTHAWTLYPNYDDVNWQRWLDGVETFSGFLSPVCIDDPETIPPPGVALNGEISPAPPGSFTVAYHVQELDVTVKGKRRRMRRPKKNRGGLPRAAVGKK